MVTLFFSLSEVQYSEGTFKENSQLYPESKIMFYQNYLCKKKKSMNCLLFIYV